MAGGNKEQKRGKWETKLQHRESTEPKVCSLKSML